MSKQDYISDNTITRDDTPVEYNVKKHEPERDSKGLWKKGVSGNPNGRPPKGKSLAERFRDNPTGKAVIDKILKTASTLGEDNQSPEAMQCAKLVIERIVPALKSSELKIDTDDSGIIVMPAQKSVTSDED